MSNCEGFANVTKQNCDIYLEFCPENSLKYCVQHSECFNYIWSLKHTNAFGNLQDHVSAEMKPSQELLDKM